METVLVADSSDLMCQVRQQRAYIMWMHLQLTHVKPENEGSMLFPKHWCPCTRCHGGRNQKITLCTIKL